MAFDFVLVVMALYASAKIVRLTGAWNGKQLVDVIIRDNILYFVV